MKKAVFMLMFAALLMGGCANMEPSIAPAVNVGETDPNFVSIDEALTSADDLFAVMFGNSTRSGRKVRNVETFRPRISTRSNSGDEMYGFYIVNYDNDGGFAMVSADRRRTPVQAISDEGSLSLSDTLENKGLSWYMNEYICAGGIWTPPSLDSLKKFKDDLLPVIPSKQYKTEICAPLLTSFMSRFHQRSPYNKYCFTTDGKQAVVGCVPLAIGTIMGYFEYPQGAEGYSFNWADMKRMQYHDSWSRLFEILGRPEYANAKYGEDATSASSAYFIRTFSLLL